LRKTLLGLDHFKDHAEGLAQECGHSADGVEVARVGGHAVTRSANSLTARRRIA